MKQSQSISNGSASVSSSSSMLTADEIQVLEILVHLPRLHFQFETRRRFPFTWACKKRRSAIHLTPSPPPLRLSSPPTPPSPLHHGGAVGGAAVVPSCETESPPEVKAKASSPATPLSFSPSESDEKPNRRRKASLKKKREEYLKIIEELTKEKDFLHGEIENKNRYYEQLKDFNLKLKARKQELILGPKRERGRKNPCLEIALKMQLVHASVNLSNSKPENQDDPHLQQQLQFQLPSTAHYIPLIRSQTAPASQTNYSEGIVQFQYASTSQSTTSLPLGMVKSNTGPIRIPDLNVPLQESYQPLDVSMASKNHSRAMAALARQKRIQIYRVKNSIAITKPRYSYR